MRGKKDEKKIKRERERERDDDEEKRENEMQRLLQGGWAQLKKSCLVFFCKHGLQRHVDCF